MRNKQIINIPDYMLVMLLLADEKERTVKQISNETNIGYTYVFAMKKEFLHMGWISINYDERLHKLYLTSKGIKVCNILMDLISLIGCTKEDLKKMKNETKSKKSKDLNTSDNEIMYNENELYGSEFEDDEI